MNLSHASGVQSDSRFLRITIRNEQYLQRSWYERGKREIIHHFRLSVDFDRLKIYGNQKIKCLILQRRS